MIFRKRHAHISVPFALLCCVIALQIHNPRLFEGIRLRTFDGFQKIKPRAYRQSPVVIVDVDDASLEKIGQWPWPRNTLAGLITRLHEAGAAVIAMDVLFAEPDRTSPAQLRGLLPAGEQSEALEEALGGLPDYDALFAQAIKRANVVTSFGLVGKNNSNTPAVKAGFATMGDDPKLFLLAYKGAVINLPAFEEAAAGNGCFNMMRETDGVLRKIPLIYRLKDKLCPSLSLEALRLYQKASGFAVKSSGASSEAAFGAQTGIASLKCGRLVIPTDSKGRLWLNDSGHMPGRFIPAWRVLSGKYGPEEFRDKIVILGVGAIGLKDIRATALDPMMPGPEIHAQALEQILSGAHLKRPDWAPGAELVYLAVLGTLMILLMIYLSALTCALFVLAFSGIIFCLSWYAFARFGWLLDPVMPSVTVLVLYLSSSLIRHLYTESEKRQIRGAFGRYLSPELVETLAEHPEQLRLGGQTRNVTVLFADIRNFTGISEKMGAEDLIAFLNRLFTPLADIILKNKGTVDKYMGDCVMAFWNAPLDQPDHPQLAVQAALEMKQYIGELNAAIARGETTLPGNVGEVKIGIGINTGTCCVGNMGSEKRFDYSVIGDTANLASRLQELTKSQDADILLGEECARNVSGINIREIGPMKIRGKEEPVRVFGV